MPRTPDFVMRKLRRPYVEYALCLLLKRQRLSLPELDPQHLWPQIEEVEVRIRQLPKGDWSAPAIDALMLMKLAAVLEPRRIVELGSYRGYSAVAMLDHAPADARLVAVDIDPKHGEAYRDTPLADRVERRVAAIAPDVFAPEELASFDLVFVDADHARPAVEADTAVALSLVHPEGTLLWHDYANWGYYTGDCGVPEVLNELAERLPVAHLIGTNLAIHRPRWVDHPEELSRALEATRAGLARGHWESGSARRYT